MQIELQQAQLELQAVKREAIQSQHDLLRNNTEQLRRVWEDKSTYVEDINQLRAQVSAKDKEIFQLRAQLDAKDMEIVQLQTAEAKERMVSSSLRTNLASHEDDRKEEIESLNKKHTEASNKAGKRIETLQSELSTTSGAYTATSAALEAAKTRIAELDLESKRLKARISLSESEKSTLRSENDKLTGENSTLMDANANLASEASKLAAQARELEDKISTLELEKVDQGRMVQDAQEAQKLVQQKLDETRNELETVTNEKASELQLASDTIHGLREEVEINKAAATKYQNRVKTAMEVGGRAEQAMENALQRQTKNSMTMRAAKLQIDALRRQLSERAAEQQPPPHPT